MSSGVFSRLAVLRHTVIELASLLAQLQRLREKVEGRKHEAPEKDGDRGWRRGCEGPGLG